MRKIWLGVVFFAASSAVFGQLDDNTLTITASRTMDLQPDQVIVGVYVNGPSDSTLDDILGALQGSGLTAANLTGVSTSGYTGNIMGTAWTFALPAPFSKLKATLSALTDVQQKLSVAPVRSAGKASMDMLFSVQGTQVSPELQASQPCPYASLAGDAKAQAQKLASAAGVSVGSIVAISDGSGTGVGAAVSGQPALLFAFAGNIIPAQRVGIFFASFPQQAPAPNCSMTVQFKLQASR